MGLLKSVFESKKLTKEDSIELVEKNLDALKIGGKLINRFAGKRHIILVEVEKVKMIEPFEVDRSKFSNMDDWIPFEDIEEITS